MVVGVIYFILTFSLSKAVAWLEKRLANSEPGSRAKRAANKGEVSAA